MATQLLLRVLALLALCAAVSYGDSNCKVYHPETNSEYDLTPLTKKTGNNWQVKDGEHTYLLNPCAPLLSETIANKKCADGAEFCQINTKASDQEPKSLGKLAGPLEVLAAKTVVLKYSGGDMCKKSQKQRSAVITFECEPSAGDGKLQFVREDAGCVYLFRWATQHACGKKVATPTSGVPTNCELVHGTTRYDMTVLSRATTNYEVTYGNSKYLLNVCQDVHYKGIEGYGALKIDANNAATITRLGLSSSQFVFKEDHLELTLKNGDYCDSGDDDDDDDRYEVTILFTCDDDGGVGKPVYVTTVKDCQLIFSWETSAACAAPLENQCSAVDSTTGQSVDLSELTKKPTAKENWQAVVVPEEAKDFDFFINVCDDLVSAQNPCREGTTICQVLAGSNSNGRSLGNKGTLIVDDGDVILRYSDGDRCTDGSRATTDIYFICDDSPSAGTGHPRLLSVKNNCQFLFNWKTRSACAVSAEPLPSEGGLSGGAIAAIVMTSLFFGYFIIGSAVKFAKGSRGVEVIPHWDLFVAAYYTCAQWASGAHRPPSGAIQI